MGSSSDSQSDVPPWLLSGAIWAWKHRDSARVFASLGAVVVLVVGGLLYKFSPGDLERADADLKRARIVVNSLEAEAWKEIEAARGHRKRAAEIRKLIEQCTGTPDGPWDEWADAQARGHAQLDKAKCERRDNLLHLAAQYLRLLAEAESEFLRAKDARDRGTPYPVAPRVQELLAPVLANR